MSSADILRQLAQPAVAAALTDGANALDQVTKDQATIAGLQTSLTAAATLHAADLAQHAADVQKIAELEAQIDPTPPPPPPAGTVFSIDAPTVTAALRQTYGPTMPHIRVFTPGKPLTAAQVMAGGVIAADRPVNSFKQWDAAGFRAQLDNIPAACPEWWACYRHEPEDNAKASGNIPAFIADYLSVYSQMDAIRKAHPNGAKVRLVKIMMRYQEVDKKQAGCTYREFHGGQQFVDAFGWDCYNDAWYHRYMSPDELLGGVVQCAADTGIPGCVPELGVALQPGDTNGAGRDALIAALIAYARAHGLAWLNWWQYPAGTWDLAHSPAGVSTWAGAMKANPAG